MSAPSVATPGDRLHTDGGLRGDYWRGTPFALLAEALPRLPIRVTSPMMRALTLEVLTVPAEPRGGAWMAPRLAALRAERLYAMGQLEAAEAAFGTAEIAKGDPARAPAEIETKLLLHGSEAACAAVAEHIAARRTLYLERASIACHAFAGAHGLAALGLGRLRERGVAVGDMFGGLVMAQQPELARPFASFSGADAWSVQLLAATRLPWPEDAMRMGTPALLRAVAFSGNGPDAVRIGAAERAFLLGAIDRAALVALYSAVRFGKDAFGRAAPKAADTPLQRALLFQGAALAADPLTRIEILANWWRVARDDRRELLAALVTAPLVHDLVPGTGMGGERGGHFTRTIPGGRSGARPRLVWPAPGCCLQRHGSIHAAWRDRAFGGHGRQGLDDGRCRGVDRLSARPSFGRAPDRASAFARGRSGGEAQG